MLSIRSQEKIIQRVVKTKTGQFVLATFLVVERAGQFHVRVLNVKPVGESTEQINLTESCTKACLPGISISSPAVTFYRHNYHSTVSPLFDQLKFFISQPTRAPSFSL